MTNSTDTYLVFVILGVLLVVAVGQLLIRSGQVYLAEVFPDPRVAGSVSKLLAVLFYLFALGVLGIISTMDVPVEGAAQTVVTKLGVVMLVLGVVFAVTMVGLARIRARRQEEEQEEALMAASMPVTVHPQENTVHPHENTVHDEGTATTTTTTKTATTGPAVDGRVAHPAPPPAV
jgi:preprotein translocase subunit SecG